MLFEGISCFLTRNAIVCVYVPEWVVARGTPHSGMFAPEELLSFSTLRFMCA